MPDYIERLFAGLGNCTSARERLERGGNP